MALDSDQRFSSPGSASAWVDDLQLVRCRFGDGDSGEGTGRGVGGPPVGVLPTSDVSDSTGPISGKLTFLFNSFSNSATLLVRDATRASNSLNRREISASVPVAKHTVSEPGGVKNIVLSHGPTITKRACCWSWAINLAMVQKCNMNIHESHVGLLSIVLLSCCNCRK